MVHSAGQHSEVSCCYNNLVKNYRKLIVAFSLVHFWLPFLLHFTGKTKTDTYLLSWSLLLTVVSLNTFILIFYLLGIHIVILTNYLAESLFGYEVFCFVVTLVKLFVVPNGYLLQYCWYLYQHMKHTRGMSWLQLLGRHTKISLQFMFSQSWLTGVNLFILMWTKLQQHQVLCLSPYFAQVMESAAMVLFCSFIWQVFKASLTTDAFMFVRNLSPLKGSQRKWELLSVSRMLPFQHGVTQLVNVVSLSWNTTHRCTGYSYLFSLFWACRYFPPTYDWSSQGSWLW